MPYGIQANEIVMLLLGVGILVFILTNRPRIQQLHGAQILLAGYYVLLLAWVLTIVEALIWTDLFNLLEHICYAVSSILIALWCWRVFRGEESRQ